tara:strand:- start:201 stop:947 length:747 start_codon:yes stop_codon:yes gene_type:complete
MIIEMFGLPYSGKSNFALYVIKKIKNYEFYSYRSIIYKDLLDDNKINYIEYFYLKLIEKRREQIHNNNFFFQFKILLLNFLILLFPTSYEKTASIINTNYKSFLKKNSFLRFLHLTKKNENVIKVINWIEQETIGYNLSKKKKDHVLFNSEGIIQRCLSLLIRLDLSESNMNKFLSICPKPDILIVFNDTKILKKFTANMNAKKRKIFLKKFNLLIKLIEKNLKKVKIFQFSLENREQILSDLRTYIR